MASFEGLFKLKGKDEPWPQKGVKHEELFTISRCELKGSRPALEDRLAISPSIFNNPYSLLVGVYDGHQGHRCAEYISAAIPKLIVANPFAATDPNLAVGDSHIQADSEWLKIAEKGSPPFEDGSTGTTVVILRNELYLAHTGDSRALLCMEGKVIELTVDHRPTDPTELERITSRGGSVVGGRVQGKLAVSRSFGDLPFKRSKILVVDPDVMSMPLTPETEFLVLACDGLFESFQPQHVIDFIRERLKEGRTKAIAEDLAKEAIELGSKDNVSVIIVFFEPKLRKIIANASKKDRKSQNRVSSPSAPVRSLLSQTTDGLRKPKNESDMQRRIAGVNSEPTPKPIAMRRMSKDDFGLNKSGPKGDISEVISPRRRLSGGNSSDFIPNRIVVTAPASAPVPTAKPGQATPMRPPPRPKTSLPEDPIVPRAFSADALPSPTSRDGTSFQISAPRAPGLQGDRPPSDHVRRRSNADADRSPRKY